MDVLELYYISNFAVWLRIKLVASTFVTGDNCWDKVLPTVVIKLLQLQIHSRVSAILFRYVMGIHCTHSLRNFNVSMMIAGTVSWLSRTAFECSFIITRRYFLMSSPTFATCCSVTCFDAPLRTPIPNDMRQSRKRLLPSWSLDRDIQVLLINPFPS